MAKGKKPKRPRRLPQPAPPSQSGPYRVNSGASTFSEFHVNAESWERGLRTPQNWLLKGAALLRSASILHDVIAAQGVRVPPKAMIGEQVVFLGALAMENALKGVVVSEMDSNEPLTRAFPESLNGHSLAALAEAADFRVLTAVEEDALGHGEDYIEWIGRYPTALRPESVAAGRAMAPSALHAAFVAMFHRAVERVAQEVTERGRHPPQYTRADWIKREQEFFLGLTSP